MRRDKRARLALAFIVTLTALSGACKSTPQSPDDAAAIASSSIITNEEVSAAGLLGGTAFEVVQRLRPRFLIDRAAGRRVATQVSVNGGQISPVNALSVIPASTVAEIRYLSVSEASQRFGSRASGAVILVTMMTR